MKKVLFLIVGIVFSVMLNASVPPNAIPFILDSHVYIQGTLADSAAVSLIYDTGADRLYLDKDYIDLSDFGKSPLRKGMARMGGAGNGEPQKIPIIIDTLKLSLGDMVHNETITPIINLREILGRHADGMIGNNALWNKPLIINYTDGYLLPVDALTPDKLEGYTKLPAHFNDNRIDIECELAVDSAQTVKGTFRLDLGCGGTIILTNAARKKLKFYNKNTAICYYSDMGVGGDGTNIDFRADSFRFLDELENVVVSASCNTAGAFSGREHVGIIGNEILSHYDLIIDAPNETLYARRNQNPSTSYQESSIWQMGYIDRTDICDGWIVSSLYEGGIAANAGIEVGDVILEINGRPVKEINWEEQRKGLGLKGVTIFKVQQKESGKIKECTLEIGNGII